MRHKRIARVVTIPRAAVSALLAFSPSTPAAMESELPFVAMNGSAGVFPLPVGACTVCMESHVDMSALTADYSSIVVRKAHINRCISTVDKGIDIFSADKI